MNLLKKVKKIKNALKNKPFEVLNISAPNLNGNFIEIECQDIEDTKWIADVLGETFSTSICDVEWEKITNGNFKVTYYLKEIEIGLVVSIDIRIVTDLFMNLICE
jgi:hypothetical protein